MSTRATVIVDIGKTLTKASLWTESGGLIERRSRPNAQVDAGDFLALDAVGIETWLESTLRELARIERIAHIFPVAHGAAAALIRDAELKLAPVDYEHAIPASIHRDYDASREPFALTGSPALPDGLNLGTQLHFLEQLYPDLWAGDPTVLPWPQYWSWRLSGQPSSEVTSLGCHTDLWYPAAAGFSRLAIERRWAARFAPLNRADRMVGTISKEWMARSGLPGDVKVWCGLHDSNAALIAASTHAQHADFTVLSTGTWFVAMRSCASHVEASSLPPERDCLINVDIDGNPVPSARFMGGREIDLLLGSDARHVDLNRDAHAQMAAAQAVLANSAMVLPSWVAGTGPFGKSRGRWLSMPADPVERAAAVYLYAALVTDAALDLIGAKDCLIIEGRFAAAQLLVAALAALRPEMAVYAAPAEHNVALGALKLISPSFSPTQPLARARALPLSLEAYRRRWREECNSYGPTRIDK
ncbi:MAG TPA: hypothetical protein VGI65_11730 [Steroidobacteraceae bacterium]